VREETKLWLEQALEDLKSARLNLDIGIYYMCAFLAEQAAEKSLKALFIETRGAVPPKTHNLLRLGRELDAPQNVLSALREINPDFVTTRYPDAANGKPSEMFDEKIAGGHLSKAEEVIKWVKQSIR
jgi:HEPN domain-containing protein